MERVPQHQDASSGLHLRSFTAFFCLCFHKHAHMVFATGRERDNAQQLQPPRGWGGGTKKILVMAPCCCCDPEKQSYLSAPEAAQLSARVSGKKKEKKDKCPHIPLLSPWLETSLVGGGGGGVESRRGRLQSFFRSTASTIYFSSTH